MLIFLYPKFLASAGGLDGASGFHSPIYQLMDPCQASLETNAKIFLENFFAT